MSHKGYISNISPLWPVIKQQEALLAVRELIGTTVYTDELRKLHRGREKRIAQLTDRAHMLRPTARNGCTTIHVASLGCLAWDAEDLMCVLAHAAERGAAIHDVTADLTISPRSKAADLRKAAEAFAVARTRAKEIQRGRAGGSKSGQQRAAAAKAKAAIIRPHWGNRKVSTADLLDSVDLSYNTAKLYLGSRKDALRYAAAAEKRNARKAKAA